jgi:hypothetical protein
MNELTAESVRYYLDYDPETGVFRWKNPTVSKIKPGQIAGRIKEQFGRKYAEIGLLGTLYPSGRLAWLYMTGEMPEKGISYHNGDGSDLRWLNLVQIENHHRRAVRNKRKLEGCPGVSWCKAWKRWYASIWFDGKSISLGSSKDYCEVVCLRKSAELRFGYDPYHGRKHRIIHTRNSQGLHA